MRMSTNRCTNVFFSDLQLIILLYRATTDHNYRHAVVQCKNVGCRICNMRKSSNSIDQCICSVQKFLFLSTVYVVYSPLHFMKWPILQQCHCKNFVICELEIVAMCTIFISFQWSLQNLCTMLHFVVAHSSGTPIMCTIQIFLFLSTVNIFFSCHRL